MKHMGVQAFVIDLGFRVISKKIKPRFANKLQYISLTDPMFSVSPFDEHCAYRNQTIVVSMAAVKQAYFHGTWS